MIEYVDLFCCKDDGKRICNNCMELKYNKMPRRLLYFRILNKLQYLWWTKTWLLPHVVFRVPFALELIVVSKATVIHAKMDNICMYVCNKSVHVLFPQTIIPSEECHNSCEKNYITCHKGIWLSRWAKMHGIIRNKDHLRILYC